MPAAPGRGAARVLANPLVLGACLVLAIGALLVTRQLGAAPAASTTPVTPMPLLAGDEPAATPGGPAPAPLAAQDEARPTPTPDAAPAPAGPPVHHHVVADGETVRGIAAQYGVSTETVLAANDLDDPNLLGVGEELVVPSVDGVLYTVRPGDTLHAIAERYAVDVVDLVTANTLGEAPDVLPVGAVLVVPGASPVAHAADAGAAASPAPQPPGRVAAAGAAEDTAAAADEQRVASAPGTYVVREGDTLRSIADATGVDPVVLLAANDLADADHVVVGTTLVIPGGGAQHTDSAAGARPAAPTARPAPAATPTPTALPARRLPAAVAPVAPPTPVPAPPPVAAARPATSGERAITAKVTGYAIGAGAASLRTASGTQAHWGTVAADTRLYPFGTRLRIEGLEGTVFVVEDTGSAVRGNVFDVWFPDAASARQLGTRTRQVTILAPGQ